ncbi:ATP-binding protein [Pseudanabaena sp. 'Roaring Creek']|uniref:ATP-binding protein n=1 Tax=Pseudanabaena sp. 'Roaring Creek' TaxID=1681830 RepID=UPI0006D845FD|nr:ATP-binding protein [Pseudanabaena sp. 'Roaring Creek']
MKIPEIPQNESEGLVALDRYKILDTLTAQVYDDLTQFTIIDTGIGFELEKFSQLFQPFSQIDSTLSRGYEGLGLGLAIVKQIVALHEGKLGANSILGKGSCFTFDLPFENNFGSSHATK